MRARKTNWGLRLLVAFAIVAVIAIGVAIGLMLPKKTDTGDIMIKTPYGSLYYPGEWKRNLRTEIQEGEPYVVSFYSKISRREEHAIFDVIFGGDTNTPVGFVLSKTEDLVSVGIQYHNITNDPEWSEEETNMIYTMQENAAYLIDHLPLVQRKAEIQQPLAMEIETPYGILHYPGKWEGIVQAEVSSGDECVVIFSGLLDGDTSYPLFDLIFDGDPDSALGFLTTETGEKIPVNIQTYEADAAWPEDVQNLFYEMQEGLNDIIAELPLEEEASAVGVNTVETPYMDLQYSNAWGENLYAEQVTENCLKVRFFGKAGGMESQILFEICFGESQGSLLGRMADTNTPVYLVFYEVQADAGLSQEELDQLYAMQEEVNGILASLNQNANFIPNR